MKVAAARFGDGKKNPVLPLHLLIAEPDGLAVLDPSHLHPNQVIGVVHHAHLIRFGIAYSDVREHTLKENQKAKGNKTKIKSASGSDFSALAYPTPAPAAFLI